MMARDDLRLLYAHHHGKVSDKWASYLEVYDRLFEEKRDRPVRLLEIGVQNGSSLEIWAKYFRKAEKIIGCDIDPKCAELVYETDRISVHTGDITKDETVAKIVQEVGDFDIIIDDGSHQSRDIVTAFLKLFGRLSEGGIYVVEDLACSYWKEYGGGLFSRNSAITFFKLLIDYCNREFWGIELDPVEFFGYCGFDILPYRETLEHVHCVEFMNSMCVIRKARPDRNRLGARVVSGDLCLVHDMRSLSGAQLHVPPQGDNPDSKIRAAAPDSGDSRISESEFRVYYAGSEDAGFEQSCSRGLAYPVDGEKRALLVKIDSDKTLKHLRLDPANAPCAITLHSLTLERHDGTALWRWDGRGEAFRNSGGVFFCPTHDGLVLLCLNDDPQFELAVPSEALALARGGLRLKVELTPRPLLDALPAVLAELQASAAEASLPAVTKATLPVGFSNHLADLAGLLKAKIDAKNTVIAAQRAEIESLHVRQQALYEQLIRAEAQLELLKEFVLPEGTGRLERL